MGSMNMTMVEGMTPMQQVYFQTGRPEYSMEFYAVNNQATKEMEFHFTLWFEFFNISSWTKGENGIWLAFSF